MYPPDQSDCETSAFTVIRTEDIALKICGRCVIDRAERKLATTHRTSLFAFFGYQKQAGIKPPSVHRDPGDIVSPWEICVERVKNWDLAQQLAVFVGGGGHALVQTSAWDPIGALPRAEVLRVKRVAVLFHPCWSPGGRDSQYTWLSLDG